MSIGSAVFAQLTVECPNTLQWSATFSHKNCPFPSVHRVPPSSTWYIGPTQVIIPNGISIGPAVFVWVPNAMLYNALSMGKNPQNCPFPLRFRHPTGGGPSHSHRQHAQKFGNDRARGSRRGELPIEPRMGQAFTY